MDQERFNVMFDDMKIKLFNISCHDMCVMKLAHKFIVYLYNIITLKKVVDAMIAACNDELLLQWAVETERMNDQ